MSDHGPGTTAADHGDHPAHDGGHGAHDDHGHSDHGHGGTIKVYIAVTIALCVLTTGSFMTWTDWWHHTFQNVFVARSFMMAISCTKALLVVLFFMHLKYEANWKYVLTFPAAFMSVFLALMLVPDVGMRFWHYSRDRLEFCAVPEKAPDPTKSHSTAAPNEHDPPHK